jgi:hypothetical protein
VFIVIHAQIVATRVHLVKYIIAQKRVWLISLSLAILLVFIFRPRWFRPMPWSAGSIPDSWVLLIGAVGGLLLVAYFVGLLWNLYSPTGRAARDSSAGGCLGASAVVTGGFLLLLAIGLIFRVRALIVGVAGLPIVAVLILAPEFVWNKIKSRR